MDLQTHLLLLKEHKKIYYTAVESFGFYLWLNNASSLVEEVIGRNESITIRFNTVAAKYKADMGGKMTAYTREERITQAGPEILKHFEVAISEVEKRIKKAEMIERVEKKHYIININLFWAVAIPLAGAIVTGAFYVGKARFDAEKTDLYEENKRLKEKNQLLVERVKRDSIVNRRTYTVN
ncbi:MAG TPA: hypothetical protein VGB56_11725 [Flavisolibacter sp.]